MSIFGHGPPGYLMPSILDPGAWISDIINYRTLPSPPKCPSYRGVGPPHAKICTGDPGGTFAQWRIQMVLVWGLYVYFDKQNCVMLGRCP